MSAREVLVWDFDGTLATRRGHWPGTLCEVVAAAGRAATPEQIRPHLQRGFPWHTPEVVRTPCTDDEGWQGLLPVFAGAIQLGAGFEEREAHRLAATVREAYLHPDAWQVYDDVVSALTELRDRGWRHVILSNHVPELTRLTDTLGLSDLFTDIYTSGRLGAEKPHRQAFEAVFAEHPGARGGWMLGDSWRADVQGGAAVGLRTILVRQTHPEALVQAATLHEAMKIIERG